jgi:ABC-type nitrate/sulfonate/bicarbonate transport system substrate-binding protein
MAEALITRSDWLAAHPPARERLTETLAGAARRAAAGEDFRHAVREFLDEFALRGDDRSRAEAIAHRPEGTGDPRHDAYLGALAEHLAAVHHLSRPSWSVEPERFLDRFWFVSDTPGFRAVSIAQAPAAFRRRGVFIPERSLHRV